MLCTCVSAILGSRIMWSIEATTAMPIMAHRMSPKFLADISESRGGCGGTKMRGVPWRLGVGGEADGEGSEVEIIDIRGEGV